MTATGNAARGRRAIAAAALGNALEWYDFTVFALFAIPIAHAFFPDEDGTIAVFKAFLAFGVGFVARPLGAVLIGLYADARGRKAALSTTILLMAAGTLLIAVTPGYASIGLAAPALLVAGRLLQGLSAGGEIGGAAAFLVEQAPPGARARHAAWLQASMALSNIAGALVAFAVNSLLAPEDVAAWGWRLPFVIGLLIAPVGLWLRSHLSETEAFATAQAEEAHAGAVSTRLWRLLRSYPSALALGFGISVLWAVSVYALVIFLPVHVQRALGMSGSDAFAASLVANAIFAPACLLFGRLGDRCGQRLLLFAGAGSLAALTVPLMAWLAAESSLPVLVIVQSLFCIQIAAFSACAPAALAELFPTAVRASGMSIAYNAATTIFGGFAPAILTWFAARGAGPLAPGWYVAAAALIGLATVAALPAARFPLRLRSRALPDVLETQTR